jgi:hypothetical protein
MRSNPTVSNQPLTRFQAAQQRYSSAEAQLQRAERDPNITSEEYNSIYEVFTRESAALDDARDGLTDHIYGGIGTDDYITPESTPD